MIQQLIILSLLVSMASATCYVDVKTLDTANIFHQISHSQELRPSGDLQGMVDVQTILNAHKYKKEWEPYNFDCVDTSVATAQILSQNGYKTEFMIKWSNNTTAIMGHVYPIVYLKNGWVAVETTKFMDRALGIVKRDPGLLEGQVVPTIEALRKIDRETLSESGGPVPPEYNLSEVIT